MPVVFTCKGKGGNMLFFSSLYDLNEKNKKFIISSTLTPSIAIRLAST